VILRAVQAKETHGTIGPADGFNRYEPERVEGTTIRLPTLSGEPNEKDT